MPKKELDVGIITHMLKNKAPVTYIAKHLGVHRDTLYANYGEAIQRGREAHREAWRVIMLPKIKALIKRRREIQEAKWAKRRRSRRGIHPSFWIQ